MLKWEFQFCIKIFLLKNFQKHRSFQMEGNVLQILFLTQDRFVQLLQSVLLQYPLEVHQLFYLLDLSHIWTDTQTVLPNIQLLSVVLQLSSTGPCSIIQSSKTKMYTLFYKKGFLKVDNSDYIPCKCHLLQAEHFQFLNYSSCDLTSSYTSILSAHLGGVQFASI